MRKLGFHLLLITVLLLGLCNGPLYAQKPDSPSDDVGTYGLAIHKVIPSARAAGMGLAFTGLSDDVSSLEYNLGGLGTLKHLELEFVHHEWLLDTRTSSVGLGVPLGFGTIGLGLKYFDEGEIDETIIDDNGLPIATGETKNSSDFSAQLAYAFPLFSGFHVGLGGRFTHMDLAGTTTSAFSGDLGLRFSKSGFMAGVAVQHLGPEFKFEEMDEKQPFTIRAGLAKRFGGNEEGNGAYFSQRRSEEFNLMVDAIKEIDNKLKINLGGEAWFFNKTVAGRVGYRVIEDIQGLTVGAGFRFNDFFFDYAYAPISDIEDKASHRFSLNWKRGYDSWEVPVAEAGPVDIVPIAPPEPAPEQPTPGIEEKVLPDGSILVTLRINFDFDKSNIRPDMEPILQQLAQVLSKYPNSKVKLEGHTDSIGSLEYNIGLSQRRANSVRSYLLGNFSNQFKDANLFPPVGYGKTRPIVPNTSAENRFKNRRTDLIVYKYELLQDPTFQIPPTEATAVLDFGHQVSGKAVEVRINMNGNIVEYKENLLSPAPDRHTLTVDLQGVYLLANYTQHKVNIGYVKQVRAAYHPHPNGEEVGKLGYTRIAVDLTSKPWKRSIYQDGNDLVIRFE